VRLDLDRERNLLRLSREDGEAPTAVVEHAQGLIDMAAGGRLIGIELELSASLTEQALTAWLEDGLVEVAGASSYIQLTTGSDEDAARSTAVELLVELDNAGALLAIGIPRRGAGYEISYPSGNR
jgi:hypothetical protein